MICRFYPIAYYIMYLASVLLILVLLLLKDLLK